MTSVFWRGGPLPAKERFHQTVKVAVEHGIHVAQLQAGPQILHLLVGMEHIRADLRPPGDVSLLPGKGAELRLAFLPLTIGELGGQHLHGPVFVLVLAPLVLTRHHDAGREVGDPHRRVGDVDVLAAGPR